MGAGFIPDGVGVNCHAGISVDNNNNANNNIIAYMFLSTEGCRKYNVLWVRTGEVRVSGDLQLSILSLLKHWQFDRYLFICPAQQV